MRAAGLIYGPLEHHLDHLAAFCSLMQIPLVLTDENLLAQARLYYPNLELIYSNTLEAPFEVTNSFETIFYCTPRMMFDEAFFIAEASLKKKLRTIWLPHGNSDKGHASYFMEGLKDEELALVYGPKMIDFLREKKALPPHIEIGNFRLEYYRRHRTFYDGLISQLNLPSKRKILYAPTWKDIENSTSFFQAAELLIDQLPKDLFLLIKLHPNLEKEIRAEQMLLQFESHPNLQFLKGFTPVYPLLEMTDLYLGDMSSIGYDFLTFNRPMFFFNPLNRAPSDPGLFLHRCGRTLEIDSNFFATIDQEGAQSHLTAVRQETYDYTFGRDRPWDQTRKEILNEIMR